MHPHGQTEFVRAMPPHRIAEPNGEIIVTNGVLIKEMMGNIYGLDACHNDSNKKICHQKVPKMVEAKSY